MKKSSEISKLLVGPETRITLYFSLSLEDGSEVDSNFNSEPATCTFGDGKLLPGFESVLIGLTTGDKRIFLLSQKMDLDKIIRTIYKNFPGKTFQILRTCEKD